jgi:hypothetical protein
VSDERTAQAPDAAEGTTQPGGGAGPATVGDVLARVDRSWRAFRALVAAYPRERIDEPIARGWTRKHMLAHVAAWHDLSTTRLLGLAKTGEPQPLGDDVDAFNARVARAAVGRTSGEVVDSLDASFSRLRRQIAQLTDDQLAAHGGWAIELIAGNTYDHYDEHLADVRPADLSSSA